MIRRLDEDDRAALVALLERAPYFNLYALGNVATNGFASDFCEFYGDVAEGRVRGMVNRYFTGWTVYGTEEADWQGLGAVIDKHPVHAERLQDNPGAIDTFLPYLARYTVTATVEDEVMALPPGALRRGDMPAGFSIRKARPDDLELLIDLYADAGDMARTPAAVEQPLRDRTVWLAEREGVAVAAALTNAETATRAMIGGVYTRPAWRGLGLSQAVCHALCEEIIESGRQPVLYWHNPAAGHVYAKLGFQRIGTWRSVRLAQRQA